MIGPEQMDFTETSATAIAELVARLRLIVGERQVRTDLRARERASIDGATMSPVLMDSHPLGLADLVALPTRVEQVPEIVAESSRLGIPITPRGKGTGNYGQAIPLHGGLVLDLSRLNRVLEVGDGVVTAEAGARMLTLETEAWASGQQLWMYPSTAHSSLGGFLSGGSCGTGSIVHGDNDEGFVAAVDVVDAGPTPTVRRHVAQDATPYVHAYGVAGIIARATVRLEPLQPWRVLWCTFPDVRDALAIFREIRDVRPQPRLVSVDDARLASMLPADDALPAGRASLRTVVDAAVEGRVTEMVRAAGGRVEAVREGLSAVLAASVLSYNHPTWWMMQAHPGTYVHLEAVGDVLVDRYEDALAAFDDTTLHFEAGHDQPFVLVNGRYEGPQSVAAAQRYIEGLGAHVNNPHEWWVDRGVGRIRRLAAINDPSGVLNPGKLRDQDAPTPLPSLSQGGHP